MVDGVDLDLLRRMAPATEKQTVKNRPYFVVTGIAGVSSAPPDSIPNGDEPIDSLIA